MRLSNQDKGLITEMVGAHKRLKGAYEAFEAIKARIPKAGNKDEVRKQLEELKVLPLNREIIDVVDADS